MERTMIKRQDNRGRGFTLAELLIALMVGSIILAAAATLASATSCAKTATDQMGRNGAAVMQLQNRLSDLLIRANQVLYTSSSEYWLWHDTNKDGNKTFSEYTRIYRGSSGQGLYIYIAGSGKTERYAQCRNVRFAYNTSKSFVTVWFDLTDNGVSQTYTVSGALRCGG